GCDVVDVARFERVLQRRAGMRARLFTPRELGDAVRGGVAVGSSVEVDRLAARFAAKEATRKALGDLRLPFHATEVRSDADGAPRLWVGGQPSTLSVSMSHDGGVAMAVVIGPPADGTGSDDESVSGRSGTVHRDHPGPDQSDSGPSDSGQSDGGQSDGAQSDSGQSDGTQSDPDQSGPPTHPSRRRQ
ncbi:MAG TPA: 4'-phosphopantetheinyl transferase superfamily protein, partial [Nitriliruptoraceae bacterium]|nr:4'-phosphopantetheinyl transferase superfamily protein [Nitriliruptoraceae bacterium]